MAAVRTYIFALVPGLLAGVDGDRFRGVSHGAGPDCIRGWIWPLAI
jgi:hypothetical protein